MLFRARRGGLRPGENLVAAATAAITAKVTERRKQAGFKLAGVGPPPFYNYILRVS